MKWMVLLLIYNWLIHLTARLTLVKLSIAQITQEIIALTYWFHLNDDSIYVGLCSGLVVTLFTINCITLVICMAVKDAYFWEMHVCILHY